MRHVSLRRALACAAVLLLCARPSPASSQEPGTDDLSAGAWRADLGHLQRSFPERHLDAFHSMSRTSFQRGIQRLRERAGAWPDHVVAVRLARVVNQVGDGHSGIRLFSDTALSFRSYPLQLRVFPDGLHVIGAGPERSDLVGSRVTAIGDRSAAAALACRNFRRVGIVGLLSNWAGPLHRPNP